MLKTILILRILNCLVETKFIAVRISQAMGTHASRQFGIPALQSRMKMISKVIVLKFVKSL